MKENEIINMLVGLPIFAVKPEFLSRLILSKCLYCMKDMGLSSEQLELINRSIDTEVDFICLLCYEGFKKDNPNSEEIDVAKEVSKSSIPRLLDKSIRKVKKLEAILKTKT